MSARGGWPLIDSRSTGLRGQLARTVQCPRCARPAACSNTGPPPRHSTHPQGSWTVPDLVDTDGRAGTVDEGSTGVRTRSSRRSRPCRSRCPAERLQLVDDGGTVVNPDVVGVLIHVTATW